METKETKIEAKINETILKHSRDRKKICEDTTKKIEDNKAKKELENKINNTKIAYKRLEQWMSAEREDDPFTTMPELYLIATDIIPEDLEKMKKIANDRGYKYESQSNGLRIVFKF